MKVLFLRHGETLMNANKLVQGWSDSRLTDIAVKKTSDLAKLLKEDNIEYAYTSDLGRAIETCQIISSEIGIPQENIFVFRNLREYNYGYFEKQPESFMYDKIKRHLLSGSSKFNLFRISILRNKSLGSAMVLDAIAAIDKQLRPNLSDHSLNAKEFEEYANIALAEIKKSLLKHSSHNAIVVSHGHFLMILLAIISPRDFKKKRKLHNLEGYELHLNEVTSEFEFLGFIERNLHEE